MFSDVGSNHLLNARIRRKCQFISNRPNLLKNCIWTCEDCLAEFEESDVCFEEPCQLPELVNFYGCMEGVTEVCDHKLLRMESFEMQYGREYCTTIQQEGATFPTDVFFRGEVIETSFQTFMINSV